VLSSEAIALRARALLFVRFPSSMLGVLAVPVTEIMGMFSLLLALAGGLPLHLLGPLDAERALEVVAGRRATALFALADLYRRMAEVGLDGFDLSSVRFWISAAERIPTDVIRDFKRRGAMFRLGGRQTEAIFVDAYGSVELSGAAVLRFSPPGLTRWDGSFLGFPVPPYKARICDEAGREVRRGEVGELWIQGPGLPDDVIGEGTGPILTTDGWVRTGDLATFQIGGLVRFVDRKSDVIRCGSYAVYPAEIERVLEAHPDVATVVAFGVPHPTKREMPVAVVVTRQGTVSEDELLAWARERLVDHKSPRRIWIVRDDEIPRAAHRVRRGELRERYRTTFASP
jgi:acyl-CoA synthetase (AMP-forming)/AMP-acid ligase II